MARIRSIHPDACDSEKLGALSADAERLFWRLQTHCDDYGKCEDNPRLINARCMPMVDGWSAKKVDAALAEMATAGLLERYVVAGVAYLHVRQWERFQHPQRKGKDTFPDPSLADPSPVEDVSRTPRGHVLSGEEGRGEGEGAEEEPSLALALVTPEIPVLDFADFWGHYPRKVGKPDAEKAWTKATRTARGDVIIGALIDRLPDLESREIDFVPHPSTWLNQRRWEDPLPRRNVLGKNQAVLERLAGGEL